MAKNDGETIVLVRRSKGQHGAHHGGSWKVAFADFATAVMALFLVLWLIAATTPIQKKAIATYFSDPGLYNRTGSSTPIDLQGSTTLLESMPVYLKPSPSGMTGLEISGQGAPGMEEAASVSTQTILALTQAARDRKSNGKLQLRALPKAILLSLIYPDKGPMFPSGSTQVAPFYEDLLIALAPTLKELKMKLIITGHADTGGSPIPNGNSRTNWLLSGERAEAVREILTFSGIPPEQIYQLAAMGDNIPLKGFEPYSPLNRRVDILILPKKSIKVLQKQFEKQTRQDIVSPRQLNSAANAAEQNTYN